MQKINSCKVFRSKIKNRKENVQSSTAHWMLYRRMKKGILFFAALLPMAFSGCTAEPIDKAENTPEIQGTEPEEISENTPMVMVDGILYCDTGRRSALARCGMMDGEISSSVDPSAEPTEDNQSNFGAGFGYQYGANGTIEVLFEDEWRIFEQRDELIWYEGNVYQKSTLSAETLEWLAWYDTLAREEQLAVTDIPEQLTPNDAHEPPEWQDIKNNLE